MAGLFFVAVELDPAARHILLALKLGRHSFWKMSATSSLRPAPESGASSPDPFKRIAPQLAALDRYMRGQAEQFEPEIRSMALYCLEGTGKRLRPALVFFSGWRGEDVFDEPLVRAAAVVEMVHLATLVHDDIMDLAEIRRNRQTATRRFGAEASVLLGDALFAQALNIASQFPTTDVCRLVSASTRRVCSGEIMQTLRRRDTNVSLAEYRRMIDLKTAELFRVSCFLGALITGHPANFTEAADKFGHHLGMAYQIYDDLVDLMGEEKHIGKTLGTDLATGKLTLPMMLLLERMTPGEKDALLSALKEGGPLSLETSQLHMRQYKVGEAVVQAIEEELEHARAALSPHTELPASKPLHELIFLLRYQVQRLTSRAPA